MASPTSTFATLRALQLVIADALDDIQRVFAQNSSPDSPPSQCCSPIYPCSPDLSPATSPFPTTPPASFPPTPLSATFPSTHRSPSHVDAGVPLVDYPSPDFPLVPDSPSEQLAVHPDVVAAASRIVAACGQMSNIVHKPFLSLCDAIMSYNLPACMRLVEHLHIAEILREAEENRQQQSLANEHEAMLPLSGVNVDSNYGENISNTSPRNPVDSHVHEVAEGLHVADITNVICSYAGINYVDPNDLVHALRLLSTHHIFRETAPDTFALTRVASLLDSGKSVKFVFSNPGTKYDDNGGTPAFVALNTDELFKSAAYLTEAFTGVQLPMLASTLNPSCAISPGTTSIRSASSFVINDPVPCAPITRSSSALKHIVYPDDGPIQFPSRSLPLTEPPGIDALHCLPDPPASFQPLAPEPSGPFSYRPSLTEVSIQTEERLRSGRAPKSEKLPAFNLAFRTHASFFEWLENGGEDPLGGTGQGACTPTPTKTGNVVRGDLQPADPNNVRNCVPRKSFRLQRFSRAMMGTTLWEAPKAILSGFDWYSLPKGSTIVDVGGGIGSTTMILARALNDPRGASDSVKKRDGNMNVRFIVQDKHVVTSLGVEAWRSKWPEILESGQVVFQDHDFFEPQSPLELPHLTRHPAVYLLRVVLHDWPDECARRILINLRVASNPETRLVIAEHVLPLACIDGGVLDHANTEACERISTEEWTLSSVLANVEGAERALVSPPLLSNLGKASANAYWMDLLMHITFNGKERTLREFCALALSAGWRVMRMTRPEGTLFAYLVCEPITLPDDAQAIHNAVVLSSELSTVVAVPSDELVHHYSVGPSHHKRLPARPALLPSPILQRSSSRCGTPTFGSRMLLPKDEELPSPRTRGAGAARKWLKTKGMGMRNVIIQKAEKQREEPNMAKGASVRDSDDIQNGVRNSSPHMRIWWKKSPPNPTGNNSVVVHELRGEVEEHRATGKSRRRTLKSSDSPTTPSPRVSPEFHQKWPSTESAAFVIAETSPPIPRARRPSVASITRKLSFATFVRRPSIADTTEPLPTPPHSATLTELAPPPNLRGDTRRSLKHLPSSPTLRRSEVNAASRGPAIPRRPSLSFSSQVPLPQPVLKSTLPRRPDITDPPKSSILKSRTTSELSPPDPGHSTELTPSLRRQRRITLSNTVDASSRTQAQSAGRVSVPRDIPPDFAGAEVKRIPNVPKLPRRLSIPMLRRKQSQSDVQDGENED